MLKKSIPVIALLTGFSLASQAQDYTVFTNLVDSVTTGTPVKTPSMESYPFIELVNHITNSTTSNLSINWRVVSVNIPADWKFTGMCDQGNCFADTNTLKGDASHITEPIAPGANGLFEARVYAPVTGTNGIGTIKVRLSTLAQEDTVIFRVTKTPTGITAISQEDNRVAVYPNPVAGGAVKVFTSKALAASRISVSNIAGQTVLSINITRGSEQTDLNVSGLANGAYLIHISDDKGKLITSRRLVVEK